MKVHSSSFYAPESPEIAGKRAELKENFFNQNPTQDKVKSLEVNPSSDYVVGLLKRLREGNK